MVIRNRKTGEIICEVDSEDLHGVSSSDDRFIGIDLRDADLRGTSLFHGRFASANLEGADLSNSDLGLVDFRGANLRNANLMGVEIYGTSFAHADLRGTTLVGIHFWLADFEGANLADAMLNETSFLECEGLGRAKGLDTVGMTTSTGFDRATLLEAMPGLPDTFLLRAGYTSKEIEVLRGLYAPPSSGIGCFVSFAEADADFVDQLLQDLRRRNVNCWEFRERLHAGKGWRKQIANAIRAHEVFILVCSRRSIYRPNVVAEILEAIAQERATGQRKLFPIRLDDHVLSPEFLEEAREKVITKQWTDNWVPTVREVHIPDFSCWRTMPERYSVELDRLVEAITISEASPNALKE